MALPARTLPRPISRRAEADQSARPLQVLIAFFTKILRGVSPKAESEQTGGTKQWLSCSGGRVARNVVTAQPPRLPLQLFQLVIYFGDRVDGRFQSAAG
jgi:hypothetical protein